MHKVFVTLYFCRIYNILLNKSPLTPHPHLPTSGRLRVKAKDRHRGLWSGQVIDIYFFNVFQDRTLLLHPRPLTLLRLQFMHRIILNFPHLFWLLVNMYLNQSSIDLLAQVIE